MRIRIVMATLLLSLGACGGGHNARDTAAASAPADAATTSTAPASTAPAPTASPTVTSVVTTTTAPTTRAPTTTAAPATTAATTTTLAKASGRLIDQIAHPAGVTKIITVHSPSYGAATATLTLWQRNNAGGWDVAAGPWTAHTGGGGWSRAPGEGTRRSPIGRFSFGIGFGNQPNPGYRLGWFGITNRDYWVEDPNSSLYNTYQVGDPNPSANPWKRSEHLIDYPVAYREAALINFNTGPVRAGVGSGIFLHVSTGGSTAGCVSLPESQLLQAMRWIDGATQIVMGPDQVIRSL